MNSAGVNWQDPPDQDKKYGIGAMGFGRSRLSSQKIKGAINVKFTSLL